MRGTAPLTVQLPGVPTVVGADALGTIEAGDAAVVRRVLQAAPAAHEQAISAAATTPCQPPAHALAPLQQ